MSMKCPNPDCSYETPIHVDAPKRKRSKTRKKLGERKQKILLSQHLLENLHTCGRSAFVCSCKKFASDSLSSLKGHILSANSNFTINGDHQVLIVPEETSIFNINTNDNEDGVEEFRPPSPTEWTHAQKFRALEADATSGKAFQPQPFAANELVKANLAIPTNTNEIRERNIQYETNLSEYIIKENLTIEPNTTHLDPSEHAQKRSRYPPKPVKMNQKYSSDNIVNDNLARFQPHSLYPDNPSRERPLAPPNYKELLPKNTVPENHILDASSHILDHVTNPFSTTKAVSRLESGLEQEEDHDHDRLDDLSISDNHEDPLSTVEDHVNFFFQTIDNDESNQGQDEIPDYFPNEDEYLLGLNNESEILIQWGDINSDDENGDEQGSDLQESGSSVQSRDSDDVSEHDSSDDDDDDLENPNCQPIGNKDRPPIPDDKKGHVNTRIRDYVHQIKHHRSTMDLSPLEHLRYLKLFTVLSNANTPATVVDELIKTVHENFIPMNLKVPSDEDDDLDPFDKKLSSPPSREKLLTWISGIVHPKELVKLSFPKKTVIQLPSGRNVSITTFDFEYQLALLLSNDHLMKKENLLFPNLDDPFDLLPEDCDLADINSGTYHRETSASECQYQNELLFPGVCFNDGTNVTRRSIEPFMYCPGIFKRSVRNLPEAWMILGYLEPEANFSSWTDTSDKYTTTMKYNDYHAMLKHIFKEYLIIQESGFFFDLYLNDTMKPHEVIFKLTIQLILGDCKGANVLCARLGGHHGVAYLCRDCNVRTDRADYHLHKCEYHIAKKMHAMSAKELRDISFWKVDNFFQNINFGTYEKYGIFGATPPELLHLFYLGLCVYLTDGFIDQLSGVMKLYLDQSAISMVIHGSRQSIKNMPSLAAYRNGFCTNVSMTTGKEKFSKVFLLYLFLLKEDVCCALNHSQKRGTSSNPSFSRQNLQKWVDLLEHSLALNEWMKSPCIKKSALAPIAQGKESKFMANIRRYMFKYKKVVRRTTGSQLCITRFHQLLHLQHYVGIHGVMSNFDGSRPEAIGKAIIKDPGRMTQKRMGTLTFQTAVHLLQSRNLQDFITILFTNHNEMYHELKLSCRLHQDLLTELIMKKPSVFTDLDDDEYSPFPQTDSIRGTNETEDDIDIIASDILHQQGIKCVGGSRFELRMKHVISNQDLRVQQSVGMLKPIWAKKQYEIGWDHNFLNGIENRLWLYNILPAGVLTMDSIVTGYTEVTLLSGDTYRAHPSYRSGIPWHDWAMVEFQMEDEVSSTLPARIMMIIEICADRCNFKSSNDNGVELSSVNESNSNSDHNVESSFFLQRGHIYFIVQSADKEIKSSNENWCMKSKFSRRFKMYPKYNIVPASSIKGPAYVIEDCTYHKLGHKGLWDQVIMISDRSSWLEKYF